MTPLLSQRRSLAHQYMNGRRRGRGRLN